MKTKAKNPETEKTVKTKHISEKDLATRWSISYRTLQRWRFEGGALPHFKIGKSIRYPLKAVECFEDQNISIPTTNYKWGKTWKK
jgi:hypothetical protein